VVEAGVADPTKVVRVALQKRPFVALFMLATEALIAERPKHGTTASDQENS
jgi:chaperonin GroEL